MDSNPTGSRDPYTGEIDPRRGDGPADVLDLGADYLVESDEGNFTGDPGTTDVMEAVEDGEVYFPPTDPVVAPSTGSRDDLEVRGGFAATSLDGPLEVESSPARLRYNDEELAEKVIAALRDDAYTTDLAIDVEVVEGVVYLHGRVNSLEDVEQAEEVAGDVEGVVDVEEDLEIV